MLVLHQALQLKICWGRSQLVVLCQVVTYPCCRLMVIFCGFILNLIGHETINAPEIIFVVHDFMGKKTVIKNIPVVVTFQRNMISLLEINKF